MARISTILPNGRILDGTIFDRVLGGGTFDPLALTWRDAVIAEGGTVSAGRLTLISNRLKQTALAIPDFATRIPDFFVFAAENESQARVSIFNQFACSFVDAPAFEVDRGFTSAAGPKYANIGYPPVSFTQNSGHYGWYSRTAGAGGQAAMGPVPTESFGAGLNIFVGGSELYLRCNDDPESDPIGVAADFVGYGLALRSGPTARAAFRNNVSLGTYPSTPSRAVPSVEFALGASGSWVSGNQWALWHWGAGDLTEGERTALYEIWVTGHLADIGATVA